MMFPKSEEQKALISQMSILQRNLFGERKQIANEGADCFTCVFLTTWHLFNTVPSLRM